MYPLTLDSKVILLPHGMKREIARILHVNERTVGRALSGKTNGVKSREARRIALQKLETFFSEQHFLTQASNLSIANSASSYVSNASQLGL